jgi:general secretion pathway protein M
MNAWWNPWWQARAARERTVLMLGGAALAIIVLVLAFEPLQQRRAALAAELPRLEADLAWMRAHAAEFTRLRSGTPSTAPALSAGDIEAVLRQHELLEQAHDLHPDARTNTVQVAFDAVPYAALLDVLHELRGHGRIAAARFESLPDRPGFVRAELSLSP